MNQVNIHVMGITWCILHVDLLPNLLQKTT